ncbi:paraquat-inducible protein B [Escherichia coli]|uniref:Paraquat-inducible protein B n=1 Tax=Escherichia coli TaxID=562 RepID=A0A376VKU9_ECOLX|nr:paraquat-inducible protein B [Escherichia coli]
MGGETRRLVEKGLAAWERCCLGVYIELQPGAKGSKMDKYDLLDSPPLAPPDAKGIRVILDSKKAGQLSPGDPVLFRGYRVGSVETSTFDTQNAISAINCSSMHLMTDW